MNEKAENSKNLDTEESRRCGCNIWRTGKNHNKDTKQLNVLRSERKRMKYGIIQITTEMVTQQTTNVPNLKCPRTD